MLKNIFTFSHWHIITLAVLVTSCNNVQRDPGKIYMPDMTYSRAYETYSVNEEQKKELLKNGIHFSNLPVAGTIKRGEMFPFPLTKDAIGDSTNYIASKLITNPLASLDSNQSTEAERLYLINCGICHGSKLDGNGPLWKDGSGPYPAAPKNLITLNMPEGQMFYSATYGKNLMGSYASQLDTKQRWMVIHYIKMKQAEAKSNKTDSTKTK